MAGVKDMSKVMSLCGGGCILLLVGDAFDVEPLILEETSETYKFLSGLFLSCL